MSSILIRRANVVYGGSPTPPTPILPPGFTQLAYIKTDGTAYIDTGIKLINVDKLCGRISFDTLDSTRRYVAGCRIASGTSAKAIIFIAYYLSHGGLSYFPSTWPDNSVAVSIVANQIVSFESYISTTGHSLIVDGVERNNVTEEVNKGTSARTLFLFGLHTNTYAQYSAAGMTIYSLEMYFEGNKIAEYVPAMRDSDSEVGFYDLVTDTLLTNAAGSGSFGYGEL